jgi:hypothetical protein
MRCSFPPYGSEDKARLERRERKWAELEEIYGLRRVDAKVVRFDPKDIPAVLIYPETEAMGYQVEGLLADPNLSPDQQIQDLMLAIYHNALILSTQGAKMALSQSNTK